MAHRIYDAAVVAGRLKLLRKETGLTQKQGADKLHWSVSVLKNYESGGRVPAEENLNALSEFFGGVAPEYILGVTDYRYKVEFFCDDMTPYSIRRAFESYIVDYFVGGD